MKISLDYYLRQRDRLLTDVNICEANQRLYRRFFEYQETKLKRSNGLPHLDAGCIKTLLTYVQRLRNVNCWFENKPLTDIDERDIRRVYDDLEDGKIRTMRGERFMDRLSYYNKIFKSKLFAMVDKAEIAKSVIEFTVPNESVVRFVLEEGVRRIYSFTYQREHRLLLWLAFDVGENINSLLALEQFDFTRQVNPQTGDPEYRIQLRKELLKRSRTARSEITIYKETVQLLDEHLATLKPGAKIFSIGYDGARKFLDRATKDAGVLCQPKGEEVTWKDLRSGMACDLLRKGWSRDEINARLGHRPSSQEIDKYINFFALDRHQPKAKVHQFEVGKLQQQLEETRSREKLSEQRMRVMQDELAFLRERMMDVAAAILQRSPDLADVERALVIKAKTTERMECPRADAVAACR